MNDELDRLVARSRQIGADTSLVIHGGGNTSSKTTGRDHLGRERRILLVKGRGPISGRRAGKISAPYLDDLRAAASFDAMSDDQMVALLVRCLADPNARRPSIETLLHAFLPARHVDHVHSDAVCALASGLGGRDAVAEALGDDVAYVEYVRPGFALSKRVGSLGANHGVVVLDHHGLVTWGETHDECLARTMELVERADVYLAKRTTRATSTRVPDVGEDRLLHLLPALRGRAAAGPATADHVLRIGARVPVLRLDDDVVAAVDAFDRVSRALFQAHASRFESDFPMHEPVPRVVLVPGLGSKSAAPTKRDALVACEVARALPEPPIRFPPNKRCAWTATLRRGPFSSSEGSTPSWRAPESGRPELSPTSRTSNGHERSM